MSWLDDDDSLADGKLKKINRKPKKRGDRHEYGIENADDDTDYKRKRAGKRSHRKKTHKDDFLQEDLHQRLQGA